MNQKKLQLPFNIIDELMFHKIVIFHDNVEIGHILLICSFIYSEENTILYNFKQIYLPKSH